MAAEILHQLPHVDHNFNHVDNTFIPPQHFNDIWNWNTTSYQQSIQMFAVIPIVFGLTLFILLMLILILYRCGKCCCSFSREFSDADSQERLLEDNSMFAIDSSIDHDQPPMPILDDQEQEQQEPQDDTATYNIFCPWPTSLKLSCSQRLFCYYLWFSLISVCIIITIIIIGYKLDESIIDTQNDWNNSYKPYRQCIQDGKQIKLLLQDSNKECNKIKDTSGIPSDLLTTIKHIKHVLHEGIDEIDEYLNLSKSISWGNSTKMDDLLDEYRKNGIYIAIGLLVFTATFVCISTIKKIKRITKTICCKQCIPTLLCFSLLSIFVILSWQFAFSIQVSDSCDRPQESILKTINFTQNSLTKHTYNTYYPIIEYYVYCNHKHASNPLEMLVTTSYNNLSTINNTIYKLASNQTYLDIYNIKNETLSLLHDYNASMIDILRLNNSLKCSNINNLDKLTNNLCVSGLNYWFTLYLLEFIVIFILILRSCCIWLKSQVDSYYRNKKENINEHSSLIKVSVKYNIDNDLLQSAKQQHPLKSWKCSICNNQNKMGIIKCSSCGKDKNEAHNAENVLPFNNVDNMNKNQNIDNIDNIEEFSGIEGNELMDTGQ